MDMPLMPPIKSLWLRISNICIHHHPSIFSVFGSFAHPSVGRCLPGNDFSSRKKAWSCGCSNIRLNSWKSIKPSPAEHFQQMHGRKQGGGTWEPWKKPNKNNKNNYFFLGGGQVFLLFFLCLARVCVKILSDSDLLVVLKSPTPKTGISQFSWQFRMKKQPVKM